MIRPPIAAVAVALLSLPSFAATESVPVRAPTKVQDLVDKVRESKASIAEAESEKRRVLGSLYSINQRMKKISNEKNHLTDELFQVQDNVKNIAKIIAVLEGEIEKQKFKIRHRLRALYKLSGQGYIAALFSSQSANDLDESLRFLKIVTENDYRLIRNYQENIAIYTTQKTKLKGQIEKLVTIERKIKKQEGLLATEHKSKSKLVSELDSKKTMSLAQIKNLRSRADGNDELSDLLKPSMFEKKGQLAGPVTGVVVQDFGLMSDEKFKIRLSHKGWLYRANVGLPVSAIFEGNIAFSGWLDGYGNTVVLDHGDHYYSVYAHISRVKMKTGDTLKQGQVFAEAGPATRSHGEGLYFEIRHFSEPENPVNWIAAPGVQISPNNESPKMVESSPAVARASDASFDTNSDKN